jgi:hypothetical protein
MICRLKQVLEHLLEHWDCSNPQYSKRLLVDVFRQWQLEVRLTARNCGYADHFAGVGIGDGDGLQFVVIVFDV